MIHADMPNDTAPNPMRKLTMRANLHSTTRAPRRGVTFLTMRPQNDAGDKQREKQIEYGYLQIVVHFGGSGRGIQWLGSITNGPSQLPPVTQKAWSMSSQHAEHAIGFLNVTSLSPFNIRSDGCPKTMIVLSFGAVSIGCHSITHSSSCVSQIPDGLMATPHRPSLPLMDYDALIAADALCGPCGERL
jgi:hypothetical protein